jgi:dolichol-phosphate mannosyltransferase
MTQLNVDVVQSPPRARLPARRVTELALRAYRWRFARFAAVGASGAVVNLGALWLLAGVLGLRDVLASALAIEASVVWNFLLNDAFTYRDRNALAQAGYARRMVRYNLVSLVGLAIQLATFVTVEVIVRHAFDRAALGPLRYAAQCAGIALAASWSFVGNLRFTWRQAPAGGGAA